MTPPQDGTNPADTVPEGGASAADGTPIPDPAEPFPDPAEPFPDPAEPAPNDGRVEATDAPKPAPNDGRVEPSDAPKLWYANERIQLPPNWREAGPAPWFRADRQELRGQPGFHIVGICPRCRHQTTSVCATEYLSNDVAGAAAAGQPAAEVSAEQAEQAEPEPAAEAIAAARSEATGQPGDSTGEKEHFRRGKQRLQAKNQPSLRKSKTAARGGPKTQVTVLRCACVENHVPATPGAFGCGSEWLLQVEYDDSSQRGKT